MAVTSGDMLTHERGLLVAERRGQGTEDEGAEEQGASHGRESPGIGDRDTPGSQRGQPETIEPRAGMVCG